MTDQTYGSAHHTDEGGPMSLQDMQTICEGYEAFNRQDMPTVLGRFGPRSSLMNRMPTAAEGTSQEAQLRWRHCGAEGGPALQSFNLSWPSLHVGIESAPMQHRGSRSPT